MVMGLLSPRGSQITTTTVAGTGLCDDHDARAMLACLSSSSATSSIRGWVPGRQLGLARWMSFELLFVFQP